MDEFVSLRWEGPGDVFIFDRFQEKGFRMDAGAAVQVHAQVARELCGSVPGFSWEPLANPSTPSTEE